MTTELYRIKELIESTNRDDVKLGCILAIREFSQSELRSYFHHAHLNSRDDIIIAYTYKDKHIILDRTALFIGMNSHLGPHTGCYWTYDEKINLDD